jgi:uncharacterized protein (DUF58 family)
MAVISPQRDGRAYAFVSVVVVAIVAAIATGRPALAAFAAPFVVALLLGLRVRDPLEISATLQPSTTTCLEGDELDAVLTVRARQDLHVTVRVVPGFGIGIAPGSSAVCHLEPGRRSAVVRLRALEWGRQHSGQLFASAWLPGGLLVWEGPVGVGERVRVLPVPIRLRQLLDPSHARVIAGVHPSRSLGEGIDFAEIRPYAPGDRMRNLNRRASGRRGAPHVNRYHPERAGDVVLLIDTFGDAAAGSTSAVDRAAIARAARASWALAQVHLAAQDRVGFLSYGRIGSWLPPGGGDRARYRLLSSLLELGGDVADGTLRWGLHPERAVPTDALVVAFTPLWKSHSIAPLHQLRRAGCNVVAVVIDTTDLVAPGDETDALARRIWELQLVERRANLAKGGVPEVLWPGGADVGQSITRLRHVARTAGR